MSDSAPDTAASDDENTELDLDYTGWNRPTTTAATPRKCCATVGGEPHTSECEAVWRATRDFPTKASMTPPTTAAWIVTADDLRVGGPFDDREDAEGFASSWNSAYPPPEHSEFVVEQITAEEAIHLDRRNV